MDSESERTHESVVTTHRPTRIDGPAQNGIELWLGVCVESQRRSQQLRRRVRSYGGAKRMPGTGELTVCSPRRSIRGAGANRMRRSGGLPNKPTPSGKPGDTLTSAR
jgi:hypothetical protein